MQNRQDTSICYKFFVWLNNKINSFGDESNLHGVGYVLSMSAIPFFKRIFWLTILVLCGFGAASVLKGTLGLYSDDVVSYSVETNYLDFDTPFPAVTVCEQAVEPKIKKFLTNLNLPTGLAGFFKDVGYWTNPRYCSKTACANCKINRTCIEDFLPVVAKLRFNCTEMFINCSWNGERFPCCERFKPLDTEYGLCFSFNSQVVHNKSKMVTVNRKLGLGTLFFSTPQNILIRVHDPGEGVSATMDNILGRNPSMVSPGTDFEAILKAEQTVSDISISTLSADQRGCLYQHERPKFAHFWPFKYYSYNSCSIYCRAMKQIELCNCTHHFLPTLDKVPVCGIKGLACLYEVSEELLSVECECPMTCEEMLYKLVLVSRRSNKNKVTQAIVRLSQLSTVRTRRQAIRGMLGLVVDIGGIGGVFFGASIISVIEIFYIFFIRKGP